MSRLTDHFARVTVISLPERAARRTRLQQHLAAVGLDGGITWMKAIKGLESDVPEGWNAGPGAWGCLQSQLQALREAQADKVASILILEDDVVFSPHTARCLPLLMAALPDDWGQFYLGGQHLLRPSRTASPLIWRAGNLNRAHAWAARGSALPQIITHLERIGDYTGRGAGAPGWHLDHQLGVAHEKGLWPTYAPSWWLAGQEADTSDISCAALRRRWWHARRYALLLPFVHVVEKETATDETRFLTGEEDARFEHCLTSDARLLNWLCALAELALDHGCLPAWHSPQLAVERVSALWPAGVQAEQPTTPDYPFDGLFRHDLAVALTAAA